MRLKSGRSGAGQLVSQVVWRLHTTLRSRGWSIERYPQFGSLDWILRTMVSRLPIDLVVDVGANEGQFARTLRRVARYRGRIVSFEPSARPFRTLERRAANDPGWEVRMVALSDVEGSLELHGYADSKFNSFLAPTPFGAERWTGEMTELSRELVPVERLDRHLRDAGRDARSVLLKVDSQGFDLKVLAGAGEELSRVVAAVVELNVLPIYDGASSFMDVTTFMLDQGFEISGVCPVTRDADGVRALEFDGVFVRPSETRLDREGAV